MIKRTSTNMVLCYIYHQTHASSYFLPFDNVPAQKKKLRKKNISIFLVFISKSLTQSDLCKKPPPAIEQFFVMYIWIFIQLRKQNNESYLVYLYFTEYLSTTIIIIFVYLSIFCYKKVGKIVKVMYAFTHNLLIILLYKVSQ